MKLKNLKKCTSKVSGEKPVQMAVAGICIAALVGAAAVFYLSVKLEKHKQKIKTRCRPTVSNADRSTDGTPDETVKSAPAN